MKQRISISKSKNFYTTYEAGNILFVSHSTIIEWIKAGKLRAIKTLGGHRRIPHEELARFIHRNKMTTTARDGKRILIVDDDETVRIGLKEMLESKGFEVDAVSDGFEAGVLAIQKEPALMILDLKMRGLDGFSACKLIRTNPLLKNMKILILTGYPSKENIDKITAFGADRCLAKPAENQEVLSEINSLLKVKSR